MSGFGGDMLIGFFVYFLILAVVCGFIGLVTRIFLKGLPLVFTTVCLAVAVTLAGFTSGMAKDDFTLWHTVPFLLGGAIVAVGWALILKRKVPRND